MVTLSLFDTLLALQSEDLMAELLLKFLVPGLHIPAAHRHKVNRCDGYALAIDHFLDLSPEVMKLQLPGDADPVAQHQFGSAAGTASGPRSLQHHHQHPQPQPPHGISKTIGANWNHYGVHSGDSLYANYRAYLFDARQKIAACQRGCARWSHGYRLAPRATPAASKGAAATDKLKRKQRQRSEKTMALVRDFLSEFSGEAVVPAATKQLDSLQSLGESSGYESFKYRVDDEADGDDATSGGGDDDRSATLDRTTASSGSDGIDGGGSTPGEAITLAEHRRKVDSWKTSSRQRADDADRDDGVDTEVRTDDEGTIGLGKCVGATDCKKPIAILFARSLLQVPSSPRCGANCRRSPATVCTSICT